tara:strand:- start:1610 stop:2725 length:1116 start_codon:yes stop_codon:yes gene_type:complete
MFNEGIDRFNTNLEQGKTILNYNEEINNLINPHLKIIQEGTIVEGMTGMNLSLKDKKIVEGLENIENEFNKTLSEYNKIYKQFSEDLLNRKNQLNEIAPYLGKNVKTSNGGVYYVNKFGKYYWYSPNAWNSGKPLGCPTGYEELNGDLPSEMTKSSNMNVGTPCEAAGNVVQNLENEDMAWVDIQGIKHSFPKGTTMSNSCAKMNIIKLSNNAYNAIPNGNPMASIDTCMALDVNPTLWKQLNELNTKLKDQSSKMKKEINNLSKKDESITNKLLQSKKKLNNYINRFNNDNKMLLNNKRMIFNAEGDQEDSELRMTSNYYFLFIWIILVLVIVSLSMSVYMSDSNKIATMSYLLIALFTLIFIIYIYNKW